MSALNLQMISSQVVSRQKTPSERLVNILQRYQESTYLPAVPAHARASFQQAQSFLQQTNRPILLDSGCGTGESAITLAKLKPNYSVIGVDKSRHRLQRSEVFGKLPENLLLVRCNLIYFWYLRSNGVMVEDSVSL